MTDSANRRAGVSVPAAAARQPGRDSARPMLAWDNHETHDLQGVVVWRMRLVGRYLAEARRIGPHRVRLMMWDQRGRGCLILVRESFSVNDPPDDPDLGDIAEWAAALEAATQPTVPATEPQSWPTR